MEIKDLLKFVSTPVSHKQTSYSAIFRNELNGETFHEDELIGKSYPYLISCTSLIEKKNASLGHIVPPEMRAVAQTQSVGSSSSGRVKVFNDADIAEYNEWASHDDKCPVTCVKRLDSNYLLFVLRNPVHWKRVYGCPSGGHKVLYDCIFDGPKGIKKEASHTMKSIGICVHTNTNSRLENMSFSAHAFSDTEGQRGLHHPNVHDENWKICMGTLDGSCKLGKLHISDIITLMEGVNMTSAYSSHRNFKNNSGDTFTFVDCGDIYLRTDMFKPHTEMF